MSAESVTISRLGLAKLHVAIKTFSLRVPTGDLLVCQDAVTKYHGVRGLSNKNLFPHGSGG